MDAWIAPVALLTALVDGDETVDTIVEVTRPVARLWFEATQQGLANRAIADAAELILDIGYRVLDSLALPTHRASQVFADLDHRRDALTQA